MHEDRRLRLLTAALALTAACTPAASMPGTPGTGTRSRALVPPPLRRVWPVMGTLLDITVWEADTTRALRALAAARGAVFRIDTLVSTYRPESELSRVNRSAGSGRATALSAETAAVLEAALRYAAATGGALDVTVGPVVDVWGFYREEGTIPPPAALDSARALVGYTRIVYDPATRSVRLPLPGMRLDFGAIAKGYAVDRGVEALRAAGIRRGMVDLGGNIRVFGTPPNGSTWAIGLRDPRRPQEVFAIIDVDSGAIATSGDYERFFVRDGVRYAHIIDPRTGRPARGIASVSVVAPTGIASDALSTALFVLGPEAGRPVAAAFDGVDAVWVRRPAPTGGAGAPEIDRGDVVWTDGLEDRIELVGMGPDRDGEGIPPRATGGPRPMSMPHRSWVAGSSRYAGTPVRGTK